MNERKQIMRAKEYIACSEASLKHPAEIRQIIDEMLPLRSSRQETVDCYNRKLIADIHLQACLLQKELYEKNNAMQTAEPEEFQMKEGEIPVEIAAAVRTNCSTSSRKTRPSATSTSCWGTFATASGRPTPSPTFEYFWTTTAMKTRRRRI